MSPETIVITGASSGIGAALAVRLGREGHRLVLAARRVPELNGVAESARSQGAADVLVVPTDVTCRADVDRLRDQAVAHAGGFRVWVNNAGQGISRSVLDLTDEDVDQVMAINLKSALYGMQAAVAHFKERGSGHVINISSFLGRVPVAPVRSIYSAAKAALNSLTANLRMDLAQSHPNIHISLVMPGVVKTDFARNALGTPPASGGPPPVFPPGAGPQTVDEAIAPIVMLIEHPVPEIYTNPVLGDLVRRYYTDVAAFEQQGPPPAP
ncbi:MAG: SDR family oxidoreductase [Gemmatimonadota bacterium]